MKHQPPRTARSRAAIQLGFLWGAAALASLSLLALPDRVLSAALGALPPCPFRAVTSLPCPACGSGRSLLALARLHLAEAFAMNPLVAVGAVVFLAGGVAALGASVLGRGVREPSLRPSWVRAGALAAVALSWTWLVVDGR